MVNLETTPLPQITVEKIYIESEKVTVNAYLTTKDNAESPYFMEEKYFTDFINVHFLLVPNDEDVMRRKLADHKSRVSNIVSNGSSVSTEIRLEWFSSLSDFDSKTISLSEAINRDSENNVRNSGIRGEGRQRSTNLRDISFSVEIPFSSISLNNNSIDTLNLYAFAHLNVRGLVEEYNLSTELQSIVNLLEIGGNLSSDKILTRNINGNLKVPEQIEVLAYNDGTPYFGSYHYHGPNPGPDGYIGYMEGPGAPYMSPTARTLKTIVIRYQKVIANFLLEDDLMISQYNGSEEELSLLENNYNSPFIADSSAMGLIFESNSGFDREGDNIVKVYDPEFQQELIQKQFNQSLNIGLNSIIYDTEHYITRPTDGSSAVVHRLEYSVDFKKLIKTKSKYPFFINKVRDIFGYQENYIYARARILSMSVFRRRLSNYPRSSNPVGTAAYQDYDTNEPEKLIASTGVFAEDSYRVSSILSPPDFEPRHTVLSEMSDSTPEVRKFVLSDYDMGMNINFGRYAYRVEFLIEDAIKSLLEEQLSDFNSLLSGYQYFLSLAAVPSIPAGRRFSGNSLYGEEDVSGLEGSIDVYTGQYTESFKSFSAADFDPLLGSLIFLFTKMKALISNNLFSVSEVQRRLVNSIIPSSGGNLESAIKFKDRCVELAAIYDNIIRRDNHIEVGGRNTAAAVSTSVKIGNKHPSGPDSGLIKFSRDIPGYAMAFPPGQVLVSYDIENLLEASRVSPMDPTLNEENLPSAILDLGPTAGDLSLDSDTNGNFWIAPGAINYFTGDDIETIVTFDDNLTDLTANLGFLETLINTPTEQTRFQVDTFRNSQESWPSLVSGVLTDRNSDSNTVNPADINTLISSGAREEDTLTGLGQAGNTIDTVANRARNIYEQSLSAVQNVSSTSMQAATIISGGSRGGNFMKKESGNLLMKTSEKSPESSYEPVTLEKLNIVGSSTVKIKIQSSGTSTSSNYTATNNVTTMSVSALKNMLRGSGGGTSSSSAISSNTTYSSSTTVTTSSPSINRSMGATASNRITSTTTYTGGY
jgi:hypothetical protein